jgi:hypothetical protein
LGAHILRILKSRKHKLFIAQSFSGQRQCLPAHFILADGKGKSLGKNEI